MNKTAALQRYEWLHPVVPTSSHRYRQGCARFGVLHTAAQIWRVFKCSKRFTEMVTTAQDLWRPPKAALAASDLWDSGIGYTRIMTRVPRYLEKRQKASSRQCTSGTPCLISRLNWKRSLRTTNISFSASFTRMWISTAVSLCAQ